MKYYAFISYKHLHPINAPWAKADHSWAAAINNYLTHWKIPKELDPAKLIKETDTRIDPVFRDEKEIYGGNDTNKILQDNLFISKSLIVICSERMNMDQQEKQENPKSANNRAYIYEEIDFFLKECSDRPIILVWIDEKPFDKNSPYCLPPQLKHRDIKVIEANTYRKERFNIQRRTTAEVAASIFQTNKGMFWDYYKKGRQKTLRITALIIIIVLSFFLVILWSFHRDTQINKTYSSIAQANELLTEGQRLEAMKLAKTAYETYPSAEGLSTLMRKCLDKSIPYTVYDSPLTLSQDGSIYTTITDGQFVNIYDANTNELLSTIDATHVESVDISKDNNLIGCISSRDSIRIFDRRDNRFMTIIRNEGTKHNKIRFNKSGKRIVAYRQSYPSGSIYNLNEPEQRNNNSFVFYSRMDSIVAWRTADYLFMENDSLFTIYGKEAPLESSWITPDETKDKWACYVYNLNQKDSIKTNNPKLLHKISIPENTTNIAASEAGHIIIATTDKIIIHHYNSRNYVSKHDYSHVMSSYTVDNKILYEELYPDWNKLRVTNILFSRNNKYALLVTSSNIWYTINLINYPTISTSNGLQLDKDPRLYEKKYFNKEDIPIGITDNGDIITYDSTITGTDNILINGKHFQNKFSKPKQTKNSKLIAHINNNQLFISEKYEYKSYITDREATSYYKSYVYRKTEHNIQKSHLNNFRERNDTTIVAISPTQKYAVLITQALKKSYYNTHLLWDIKTNQPLLNLSELSTDGLNLDTYYLIFFSDEEVIGLTYQSKPLRQSSFLVLDILNKKILFENEIEYIPSHNHILHKDLIIYRTEDNKTIIYDTQKRSTVRCLDGKYYLNNNSKYPLTIMPLKREIVNGTKFKLYNILYNIKENQLIEVPDSIKRIDLISPDGKYIVDYYVEDIGGTKSYMLIRDTQGFKQVHSIQVPNGFEHRMDNFHFFTPDSKYFLYKKKEYSDLTLFDLEQGKEVFSFKKHTNIIRSRRTSPSALDYNTYWGFAFSDKHIALNSNKIILLDFKTGNIVAEFDFFRNEYPKMQFTPNGRYLIADNYLIDTQTMKCIDAELKEDPIYIQDDCIIYRDHVYPILSEKQLYEEIGEQLSASHM